MNIMGALDNVTAGEYFLDGIDVSSLGENELSIVRGRKIGFIFQFHNLIPTLTVLENVLSGLEVVRPLKQNDEEVDTETLSASIVSSRLIF